MLDRLKNRLIFAPPALAWKSPPCPALKVQIDRAFFQSKTFGDRD